MILIDKDKTDIPYYSFEKLEQAGFINAFTTKFYVKDGKVNDFFQPLLRNDSDPEEVSECRSMLAACFNTDMEHIVPSAQKHMTNIHRVDSRDLGPLNSRRELKETDGLITDIPGVMLQTFGADCPSVYLADPVHRAVGLCHSGRKGTQHQIAAVMLKKMTEAFGTGPSDVIAAISPGICPECYEVGIDVATDFINDYVSELPGQSDLYGTLSTAKDVVQERNKRYYIDLFRAIRLTLESAGVPADNIEVSDMCTKCRSDIFYSFRAEGRISNGNCALIMIREYN